ncbi:MAG TPA: hypothetical protein VFH51_05105, partial [Myxococcota bacterium]|nr:hypothetical protein [Myxococcota bacterium]
MQDNDLPALQALLQKAPEIGRKWKEELLAMAEMLLGGIRRVCSTRDVARRHAQGRVSRRTATGLARAVAILGR